MSRFQGRQCAALVGVLIATLGGSVGAQSPASAPLSDADRAKRDADKVFQWIRLQSDKPRKVSAPAADKPLPPTPPARVAAKPARAAEPGAEAARSQASGPTRTAASGDQFVAAAPTPRSAAVEVPVDASAPLALASAAEEDVALTPVLKTEPQFPTSLMRQLRKGQVQVGFTVMPDGSVAKVQALSTSHARLSATAVETVSQWRFQPLRQAKQAVVELGFNLD